MPIRTERRHSGIRLAECFEAFEDSLSVVEDGGPGVERQRGVGHQPCVVPPGARSPVGADHVLGEDPAKAWVREHALPVRGGHAGLRRVKSETDSGSARAHALPTVAPWTGPGGALCEDIRRPGLATRPRERKEGVLLDLPRRGDRQGHHEFLDNRNRFRRQPDPDPLDGEDWLLRLGLARPTRGRPACDYGVEEVSELQFQDLVEIVHLY